MLLWTFNLIKCYLLSLYDDSIINLYLSIYISVKIRILLFRENDKKGRRLLFDSEAVQRIVLPQNDTSNKGKEILPLTICFLLFIMIKLVYFCTSRWSVNFRIYYIFLGFFLQILKKLI